MLLRVSIGSVILSGVCFCDLFGCYELELVLGFIHRFYSCLVLTLSWVERAVPWATSAVCNWRVKTGPEHLNISHWSLLLLFASVNNNRIQRCYSRFYTISSQRREPSPTRTLKWPGCSRAQITCNISNAYHVQVSCYMPLRTKGQLSY